MLYQYINETQQPERPWAVEPEKANGELSLEILKRRRLEAKLTKMNRALAARSKVQKAMFHAGAESELIAEVCRIMVETGGYIVAWVCFNGEDQERTKLPVVQYGREEGRLNLARIHWENTGLGRGPAGTAMRTGKPVLVQDIRNDSNFTPWRDRAIDHGCASCVALPLLADHKVFGSLSLCSGEAFSFDAEEVELLEELSGDLAFGIVSLRNNDKRRSAEQALSERVEELKVLNQLGREATARGS